MTARREWTQRRLRRLYRYYNARYFDARLPEYRIVAKRRLPGGLLGCTDKSTRVIVLKLDPPKTSDLELKATLLHEMCHAATRRLRYRDDDAAHGGEFNEYFSRMPEYVIAAEWLRSMGMSEREYFEAEWAEGRLRDEARRREMREHFKRTDRVVKSVRAALNA
jgi:hypothetical protein